MEDNKKQNLRAKTIELAEQAHKSMLEKIDRLFSSNFGGSIDLDNYKDDYELPRIVLYVALKDATENATPTLPGNKEEAENLYLFA